MRWGGDLMKFPREVIWVGACCYVKPPPNKKKPPMGEAYPRVIVDGTAWWGHRLSYHINKETIPNRPSNHKEGFVLHTCDHKWCVNPEHLYLGTARQNVIDSYDRAASDRRHRISLKMKGRPKSEETRKRMGLSQIGNKKGAFKRNQETRQRMSEAGKLRWARVRGEINC
jgi:hypothetical protein